MGLRRAIFEFMLLPSERIALLWLKTLESFPEFSSDFTYYSRDLYKWNIFSGPAGYQLGALQAGEALIWLPRNPGH